ncbi:MAG TPA: AgmX/PglI C-terminal domain-containing protein [Polyangia bacterium]|jgi:hypothetical protein|nr:AgmX/PglI C-terminal domain-containing protein [Polyangia bacterium]
MSHLDPVRLADYALGRVAPARRERMARHLAECESCRQVLSRVGGAQAALKAVAEQSPAASVGTARMEATLRWTWSGKEPRAGRSRHWPAALAFGLAAAAAVGFWIVRPRHEARVEVQALLPKAPPSSPAAPAALPLRPLQALVTLVAGDAVLRHEGRELDPRKAGTLTMGDRLVTRQGGRVGFQWGEGSGALLEPDSALGLARLELRAQALELDHGRVAVRVGPHQPGESLRVVTPHHEVSVHGTWFVVGASASGTTVEVLEGVVAVSLPGQSEGHRIAAPMKMFFPPGQIVGERVHEMSAREASALRAASEFGMLPWNGSLDSAGVLAGLLAATSSLQLQSEPAGQIAVDGVSFGAAPLWLRRPHGRHLVEFTRPGFAPETHWMLLEMEPGELRTSLRVDKPSPTIAPSSPEEVREMARQRQRQIEACHTHALKRDPDLAGTISLRIRVGDAGQVVNTAVEDDTLADPTVAECLRREVSGWKWPRARNVTLVFPFVFRTPG